MTNELRAVIATACLCVASVSGQAWELRPTTTKPTGRVLHAMTYDVTAGRALLFGGMRWGLMPDAETWSWDGSTWTLEAPSAVPPARWGHGMGFDAVRGEVVLFGGTFAWGSFLDDTWTWDGSTWHQHSPANRPSARAGAAMAFDHELGRLVLFGGADADGLRADTWWWDGSDWQAVFTATAPTARHAHTLCSDPIRGRIVLFGGRNAAQQNMNDLHEWDGAQWHAVVPAVSPSPRFHHTMAFDAIERRCILHAGHDGQPLTDTWAWNGVGWTPLAAPNPPSLRYQSAMTFDVLRGRTVLFGGGDGATLLDDVWERESASSAPVATAATFGVGCGTPPLGIAPATGSRPVLGGQQHTVVGNVAASATFMAIGLSSTHLGAIALPLPLALLGMNGCRLYHDFVIGAEPCTPAGAMASHFLQLPAGPEFVGVHVYLQAFGASPLANPAGLVTSNAIDLILGDV